MEKENVFEINTSALQFNFLHEQFRVKKRELNNKNNCLMKFVQDVWSSFCVVTKLIA